MKCPKCEKIEWRNSWKCSQCKADIDGGVVFITGISGTKSDGHIKNVLEKINKLEHKHDFSLFDVGQMMRQYAEQYDRDINWDCILNSDARALRYLRALVFKDLSFSVITNPKRLHIVDLHLSFRWFAYLTRGFEPHILEQFKPYVRCFINLIEDLSKVQEHLKQTSWGERNILELLVWRDEELFLTNLFADTCEVDCYAVANGEPPSTIERLIWHPEFKKVYLSFPITHIKDDASARKEIESFRDQIREFLVVFDPYACRDYEETYNRTEMHALRSKVGETTIERDFRFIDQADAVVVYYPRKVQSTGVDAEMKHAKMTGKQIFLYCPEDLGGGPFAVLPDYFKANSSEFVSLLKEKLKP